MNIEQLKHELADYAKDIKLNLGNVLNEAGTNDLNQKQVVSIALAAGYATRNKDVISATTDQASALLTDEEIQGIKAATTIMAMNNIYYRFTHSMDDTVYQVMPAKLRMNVMANPSVDKIIFELCSLAVSAINGCSKCMNAHSHQLEKNGLSKLSIQSTVRIASVVHAVAIAREIAN